MFYCHISLFEDERMMGLFIVINPKDICVLSLYEDELAVNPNPVKDKIYLQFKDHLT